MARSWPRRWPISIASCSAAAARSAATAASRLLALRPGDCAESLSELRRVHEVMSIANS